MGDRTAQAAYAVPVTSIAGGTVMRGADFHFWHLGFSRNLTAHMCVPPHAALRRCARSTGAATATVSCVTRPLLWRARRAHVVKMLLANQQRVYCNPAGSCARRATRVRIQSSLPRFIKGIYWATFISEDTRHEGCAIRKPRPLAPRNRRLNSVALLDPLRSVQFSSVQLSSAQRPPRFGTNPGAMRINTQAPQAASVATNSSSRASASASYYAAYAPSIRFRAQVRTVVLLWQCGSQANVAGARWGYTQTVASNQRAGTPATKEEKTGRCQSVEIRML